MNEDEQEGVKAIIYLQALAGIDEPVEKARRGWQSMTPRQKEATLDAYKIVLSIERNRASDRKP